MTTSAPAPTPLDIDAIAAHPQWWVYQRPDRTCFVERAFVEKGPAIGERIIATSFHETDAQAIVQAMNSSDAAEAEVRRLQGELEATREDKKRLDFLDECNRRLNAYSGTTYGWKLILNHNVNRLMLGHMAVDLHDSEGGKAKLPSCRAALDEAIQLRAAALLDRGPDAP